MLIYVVKLLCFLITSSMLKYSRSFRVLVLLVSSFIFFSACSFQSDESLVPGEDDIVDLDDDGIEEVDEENEEDTVPEIVQGEVSEDFQHIANSLTRYLIEEYDGVAVVENCPGGYEYNEFYEDYHCADQDNRWLEFEWLDGLVVKGPEEAGFWYLADRTNPGGASFQRSVDPTETYWMYLWYSSDDAPVLHIFNMRNGEDTELMSFYKTDYSGCEDGVRFIGWNDSGDKFALVSGNTENTELYPDRTKIFVLTVDGGQLLAKDKYSLPLAADCSANNGPFFMVDWYDENTIGYYLRADGDYDTYLDQMDSFWGGNKWDFEYAEFLSL